jgi:hypothetical protein
MQAQSLLRRARSATVLVLRVLYWTFAGSMILGGATGALLLVATFLFPFLPFIGFVLVMQGAAFAEAARARTQATTSMPPAPTTLRSRELAPV